MDRPTAQWVRWCGWRAGAGRLRKASRRPRGRWDWISMKCAATTPGIDTSRWRCWPMRTWKSRAWRPWTRALQEPPRLAPRAKGGGHQDLIPLTVPEVRRLVLLVAPPPGADRDQRLRWAQRRSHDHA